MTDYRFTRVLVWDNLGGGVKAARNQTVTATDPTSGVAAAGLKVSGQPVSSLTSDSSGHVDFTSTQGTVRITSQFGFWQDITSPDWVSEQATSAGNSATAAANSAATASATTDTAIANNVNTAGTQTRNALDGRYAPITGSSVYVTQTSLTAAFASSSSTPDLTIQRLDRQNGSAARSGGGLASIAYTDAPEFVEDWTNLNQWSASNAQVSGNRYYFLTGSQSSVIHAYPVAANETAHITGLLYWKAGGTGAAYFGIDVGTAGHAPVASSPDGLFLGFNGSNARAVFNGSTAGTTVTTPSLIGANPTVDTTYSFSIDVGIDYVSLAMHALGSSTDSATAYITRSAITAAGKGVNNISLFLGDTRALTGHSFGPVVAVKSRQPTRTKTVAGVAVEGAEHRQMVSAPSVGGDAWRFSIPASYDPRTPSPVVIYCHQSLTGSQLSPWSESRAQPVTQALLNAGYLVAAANDGGDRWGNQASLDNYLALYRHLRDRFNTGAVFMLGVSMGGMTALNALTHTGWPTPAAVATIGGVVDLSVLFANNTGSYAPGIRAAYGIAADGSDYATKTAGYNPVASAGSAFRGVPFRLYTSTGDTTVPKTSNQDVLAAKVAGISPEANVVLGTGAHLDASQFQASDLVAFFGSYR